MSIMASHEKDLIAARSATLGSSTLAIGACSGDCRKKPLQASAGTSQPRLSHRFASYVTLVGIVAQRRARGQKSMHASRVLDMNRRNGQLRCYGGEASIESIWEKRPF